MEVKVRPLYEGFAEGYDKVGETNPSIVMEKGIIIPLLNPKKRDRVLEVGCGTGRLTIPVAKRCKEVIAIDFSGRMIDVAKRKSSELNNILFKRVDVRNGLPFEDEQFDKVLAALVVNHIDNLERFFEEVHRVLKKGGIFVFDDINPDSEFFEVRNRGDLDRAFDRGENVFANHSLDQQVNLLHKAGFEIDKVKFARFDEKIRNTITERTYEANKGHTLGWIFKAKK